MFSGKILFYTFHKSRMPAIWEQSKWRAPKNPNGPSNEFLTPLDTAAISSRRDETEIGNSLTLENQETLQPNIQETVQSTNEEKRETEKLRK